MDLIFLIPFYYDACIGTVLVILKLRVARMQANKRGYVRHIEGCKSTSSIILDFILMKLIIET